MSIQVLMTKCVGGVETTITKPTIHYDKEGIVNIFTCNNNNRARESRPEAEGRAEFQERTLQENARTRASDLAYNYLTAGCSEEAWASIKSRAGPRAPSLAS